MALATTTQTLRSKEYETIYILRPDIDADTADRVQARVAEVVGRETGKLVKVDEKYGTMVSYSPPTDNSGAYHAVADPRTKVIWLTEQTADKIARFDPKTEKWTEFSLPIVESDARRIELDPTNPNRIWWSGDTSSHLGYIEVLDK